MSRPGSGAVAAASSAAPVMQSSTEYFGPPAGFEAEAGINVSSMHKHDHIRPNPANPLVSALRSGTRNSQATLSELPTAIPLAVSN
jgi:hypothetical protein